MKFQFSGHVILYGYEMSPGQFSSKKRTNYDFFGYVKDWPKAVPFNVIRKKITFLFFWIKYFWIFYFGWRAVIQFHPNIFWFIFLDDIFG